MLFKSALVTSASGSIGGMTAGHNRAGLYLRARRIPVYPATTAQQQRKASMIAAVAAWQQLAQEDRDAWDAAAGQGSSLNALGDTYRLTGQNMFVSQYAFSLGIGEPGATDAPTVIGPAVLTPPTFTATASTGNIAVSFNNADAWATATGGALAVFIGHERAPSRLFYKGPFRYAVGTAIRGAGTPPSTPVTIANPVAMTAGRLITIRFRAKDAENRLSTDTMATMLIA